MDLSTLRVGTDLADEYRSNGWWRDSGLISDLRKWRDATPDAVAIDAFVSGGQRTTLTYRQYADMVERFAGALAEAESISEAAAVFTPNSTMYSLGYNFSLCIPLVFGARAVLLDSWSGAAGLAVLEQARVAVMMAGARYYDELVAAAVGRPTPLPSLRVLAATGTKIPSRLVKSVIAAFGISLRAEFGMTEVGCTVMTRADDPIDWALQSDGRPYPSYEIDIRSAASVCPDQPGRLFVRGPAVCLATARGEDNELTVTSKHDDGWYDSGDLAAWDGHGGIRLMGRVADRIGKGFMIPVADVEDQLMQHPDVADVAVVGYLDEQEFEYPCAVITVRGASTPTLDELREYLIEQGMTEWYLPARLERLDELPRTSTGKVRKELLRSWLNAAADVQNLSPSAADH